MASLALRNKSKTLYLKPHQNLLTFTHHYSSSSSNNDNDGNVPPKPSSFSSYFNQQPETSSTSFRASNYNPQGSKPTSLDEIKKNLSEYRRRTGPETPFSATQKPISSPNQFNKFGGNPNRNPNPSFPKGGPLSLEKIKESLMALRGNGDGQDKRVVGPFSLNNLNESFKTKPSIGNRVTNFGNNSSRADSNGNKSFVIGGSPENLPKETFGKEMKEKEAKKNGENDPSQFELFKPYSLAELGMKLKELRPDTTTLAKKTKKGKDGGEEGWFSLSELQQRLGKLKEIEERESVRSGNTGFVDLRRSLVEIKLAKDEKPKNASDILSQSSFMVSPPKEHLVEKYFHPDNMSAAEKLKLELKKVRDEFKMSESDCGSTRVQIAQLTTEILLLSSVLHKKDKHSRRGLQAKVQQRKKLLKYLRRTDWDSYCFVLSKLGLRDNPDYKN